MKMYNTYESNLQPPAHHITGRVIFLILLFIQFSSFNNTASAQCENAPSLVFANPVLISGADGQVGAVYLFPNVGPGLDAHIEILTLANGALLGEIDNTTQGYYDAWQPYVTAGANDTSYLDWRISFKKAGTNTDTVLECLSVTAVDVDGDSEDLKEFIRASTPGAYAIDPFTTLTVTFDGVHNTAIGQLTTIPLIDTNHREVMFQMNFANVSSIIYRNGSISTKDDIDVRHTCIYFKPFFLDILVILPVRLHAFNATEANGNIRLSWLVQDETNMHSYTVQRSVNGEQWTAVAMVFALNTSGYNSYYAYDHDKPDGIVYYRIQLTDHQGKITWSDVVLAGKAINAQWLVRRAVLQHNLSLEVIAPAAEMVSMRIYTVQGQLVAQKQFTVSTGSNRLSADLPPASRNALYIVTLTNRQGMQLYTAKLLQRN